MNKQREYKFIKGFCLGVGFVLLLVLTAVCTTWYVDFMFDVFGSLVGVILVFASIMGLLFGIVFQFNDNL